MRATRILNSHFRVRTLLPDMPPSCRALLRSQAGPQAGRAGHHAPTARYGARFEASLATTFAFAQHSATTHSRARAQDSSPGGLRS